MAGKLFKNALVPLCGIGECEMVLFPIGFYRGIRFRPADAENRIFGERGVKSLDDGKLFLAILTPGIKKYNEGELPFQVLVTDSPSCV